MYCGSWAAHHSDAVELGLFTFDKKHGRLARLAWQSSSHQIHLRRTSYRLSSESKQLGRRSLCSVLFPRVRYSGGDVFRSAEVHPPPPFRRTTPLPLLRVSPKDLRSFVWTAVSYMFKDTLKLPPSSSQIVFSISFFSWSIKPLYRIFLLNLVCIGHVLDSEGDYVEALKAFIDSHRTFIEFEELTAAYAKGEVHPGDIKPYLAKALNRIMELKKEMSKLTLQRDLAQSQVKDLVQVLGDDKLSPFFRCDLCAVTLSKSKWT
ncbi:hypothetical protein ACLB2K_057079 [Fragaria x ananassa]